MSTSESTMLPMHPEVRIFKGMGGSSDERMREASPPRERGTGKAPCVPRAAGRAGRP